ncbi:ACT domain, Myc-type, basic helix-loop-helix (bHLH) domain protein [Artemisia annua]|uniref:ACT domain, Myc-type, basic helix-loop-helix (BHLH) domain protein n=1 Tax=Artemisia annua TaxID=35608 RepID=A0A2U1NKK0_ARTAN|nr:ACT domain, Myc-type, basic helix-loop-helix (bHLH) domain protein [Artemisia annua]
MELYGWTNPGFSNLGPNGFDGSLMNSSAFNEDYGNVDGLFMKSSESLVLDNEKSELVKGQSKVIGKKIGSISDEKAVAALKSHSEAERRRRERINAHLDTLRGLVPCNNKMDKATLLAEVIRQIKQLKVNATQASTGLLMPEDVDEVKIEKLDQLSVNGSIIFHASFGCKHRPELLTDVRKALVDLKVHMERAQLSYLGDHVKIIFDFMANEDLVTSVREALTAVIEKGSISPEYSLRTLPNKRRRYCL